MKTHGQIQMALDPMFLLEPPLSSKLQPIWENYLESLFARSGHLDTLCEADMINGDWMKQVVGCQEWR